ncbi:winged helix-turn-helix transcriptional regulator [Calothrix sp. UHCC 0171]|uniref:winged helix-turn-helix transcriptional regulator n=1 Tax=Calothrix sp. UHCC 0171 TaxID=3110245 RepID=UPI002B22043C|nr:winged helix-turn-helix transcriptional regulator [Calothrix sp. UHCC 0171]MEA5571499.1 winged helix-turn-helix transcriptional regulator [Calothrix sp. UHCC 0171]
MDTNIKKYSCPVEVTIEAIGGKWKCLILWWLRRDARRFSELKLLISNITQKVLTQQLRELEKEGIIYRESFPEFPPRVEYALTPHGKTFTPITEMMCEWGRKHRVEYQFNYCRLENMRILVLSPDATALCRNLEERHAVAIALITIDDMFDAINLVKPDAMLIDLAFINNDDTDLLTAQIKQIQKNTRKSIPIIAIVSGNNSEERGRAFKMGFAVHIPKPVETIEMVSTLASLMAKNV